MPSTQGFGGPATNDALTKMIRDIERSPTFSLMDFFGDYDVHPQRSFELWELAFIFEYQGLTEQEVNIFKESLPGVGSFSTVIPIEH